MTPKEKAKELFKKVIDIQHIYEDVANLSLAKQCALIVVEEAKTACTYVEAPTWVPEEQGCSYWNQVQQEIEKL
jgi:hypothetical protein